MLQKYYDYQLNGKSAQENYIDILRERQRIIRERLQNNDDCFTLKIISEVKNK